MSAEFFERSGVSAEELLSENPRVNTGTFKESERAPLPQEALEVLQAFEILSWETGQKRQLYDTWIHQNVRLIQTPAGPQTLAGYVNKLERSCIALNKALTEAEIKYNTVSVSTYLNYRIKLFVANFKRRFK